MHLIISTHKLGDIPVVLECICRSTTLFKSVVITSDSIADDLERCVINCRKYFTSPLILVQRSHKGAARRGQTRNNGIRAIRQHVAELDMLYFLDGDICLDASHFYAVRRMHEYDVIIGRVVRLAVDESNTFRNQMISGGAFSLPFGQRLLFAKKVMKAKISCWARHLNIPLVGNVLPTHWPDLRSGNFAVRAGVFYKVNGFDESMLGWGGEDSDLGRRLYQSGARVGTFPWGCKAYHLWHPSAAEPSSSCRLHERLLYKTKVALHGLDSPFGQNDSELHILQ